MTQSQDRRRAIADFIARRTDLFPYAAPAAYRRTTVLPSATELAKRIVNDPEAVALRLGTWLGTTDGQIISDAVATVIPPMYASEYKLVVDALTMVASHQQSLGRQTAGALSVLALLVGILMVAASQSQAKPGRAAS